MKSETMAGFLPTPKIGIIRASRAKEGTVCRTDAIAMTIFAAVFDRVKNMPRGTAIKTPKKSEIEAIKRCSRDFDRISVLLVIKKSSIIFTYLLRGFSRRILHKFR